MKRIPQSTSNPAPSLFPEAFKVSEYSVVQARAARNIKRLHTDVLAEYQLTMPEWHILGLLAERQLRVGAIAKELDVQSTYVTAIAKELQAKELIAAKADKADGRSKWLQLTPAGRRRVKQISGSLSEAFIGKLPSVSPREFNSYIHALSLLAQN